MLPGQRQPNPTRAAAYRREGFWPGRLITDYFEAAAAAHPEHPAVVDNRFGAITYAQLAQEVERLALGLRDLGVSKGDCFIVQLPNWRVFTAFHLALTYLGALTVNIPVTYRHHELRFIARATRATGIVVPDEFRGFNFVAMLGALLSELPALRAMVVVGERVTGGMRRYTELVGRPREGQGRRAAFETLRPGPDDVTGICFTSGTTGEPKGAMHTSNTFGAINVSVARAYGLGSGDVIFMPGPVGHSIGLMHGVRLALFLGATLVLQDQWEAGRAIGLMSSERASFAAAPPPFLHDMLSSPALSAAGQLPSLRVFLCGGDFVSERLLRAAQVSLPFTLVTALWGMTEGIGTACRPGTPPAKLLTTAGHPFPGTEVRIASPDGEPLPPAQEGELLIRGPQVFVGYFQRPDLNAVAFLPDGFFRTGDLARVDEDGYVSITGRIKDLIVRGGVKISPTEIERALSDDPRIKAIAIVGMPDERLGERVCAFVVPRSGAALSLQDLADAAEQRGLAKQKWPERVESVAELPVTPSGKIQRHVLQQWLIARPGRLPKGEKG